VADAGSTAAILARGRRQESEARPLMGERTVLVSVGDLDGSYRIATEVAARIVSRINRN
jgi:hypothetical protein